MPGSCTSDRFKGGEEAQNVALERLHTIRDEIVNPQVPCVSSMRIGIPYEEIVDEAEKGRADLTVVGTQGKSGVAKDFAKYCEKSARIFCAQTQSVACGELGFQLGDAGFQRRDIACQLGGSEARGDVLRAVPIVRNDLDEEQPLYLAA